VIPAAAITEWSVTRAWPSRLQVEQDLLLARLIVDVYRHPLLSQLLVFRGGTCLHQLRLDQPLRFSEDLDFVRRATVGLGDVFDALRQVTNNIGLEVAARDVSRHAKFILRGPAEDDARVSLRIKVEVSAEELPPASRLEVVPFRVDNSWFSGTADVLTFDVHELVATKIRALYQRRKGRDLFDLWLALDTLGLNPERIVEAFAPYRPPGFGPAVAVRNLRDKLRRPDFRTDIQPLLAVGVAAAYDPDAAGAQVIEQILSRIPSGE